MTDEFSLEIESDTVVRAWGVVKLIVVEPLLKPHYLGLVVLKEVFVSFNQ